MNVPPRAAAELANFNMIKSQEERFKSVEDEHLITDIQQVQFDQQCDDDSAIEYTPLVANNPVLRPEFNRNRQKVFSHN